MRSIDRSSSPQHVADFIDLTDQFIKALNIMIFYVIYSIVKAVRRV